MSYVITGLDPAPFRHLYGMTDAELAQADAVRMIADKKPGYPCRVTLEDAEPGAAVLLVNHEHLPVDTPIARAMRSSSPRARRHRRVMRTRFRSSSVRACCRCGRLMRTT
ncbi:DUF1203 domain-containing protein [Sphingomonas sp. BT-65]|uniref:DUF1203 domain-containing protein n=1 Tax=Sphingomonas sp. BT-65 TaxID=2989821 RepID=UPI0022359D00|nr:DUF1203 domain-containing protein [Sphingomonas sp. BT-65]MCW4461695.1 DUF1203 domain-containing protein [Sphingomonas sp. BT-65]